MYYCMSVVFCQFHTERSFINALTIDVVHLLPDPIMVPGGWVAVTIVVTLIPSTHANKVLLSTLLVSVTRTRFSVVLPFCLFVSGNVCRPSFFQFVYYS